MLSACLISLPKSVKYVKIVYVFDNQLDKTSTNYPTVKTKVLTSMVSLIQWSFLGIQTLSWSSGKTEAKFLYGLQEVKHGD